MRTLRRFILLFAIAIMLFTMVPLTANTEDWIPSGFKDFVFDAKFYAAKYPDVAAECGDSEDSLLHMKLQHQRCLQNTCSGQTDTAC